MRETPLLSRAEVRLTYRWGVWKMDESVDTLLDLLPEREYYEREVQRFVASHRRLEWLSVRALLFRQLGEQRKSVISRVGNRIWRIIHISSAFPIRKVMCRLL